MENIELGVCIFSFNRPYYLKKMLSSLENNLYKENCHFYLFQDGHINKFSGIKYTSKNIIEKCIEIFRKSKLPNKNIICNEFNLGIGITQYNAKEFIFNKENFKYGLFIEDDCILAKSYIYIIKVLLSQFENRKHVGTVQAIGISPSEGIIPKKEKIKLLRKLTTGNYNFWAWATWKNKWKKMKPFYLKYHEFIKNIDYRLKNHFKIRKFFYKERYNFYKITSQDNALAWARYKAKLIGLNTIVNRFIYIGQRGIHQREKNYKKEGWHKVKLHEFEEDFKIKNFEEIDEKEFLNLQESLYSLKNVSNYEELKLSILGEVYAILQKLNIMKTIKKILIHYPKIEDFYNKLTKSLKFILQ